MSDLVFKIMKAGRSFHAVDYNDRKEVKGQARLLHWQGFGAWQDGRERIGSRDMQAYLQRQAQRNPRVTHPQFHAILSSRGESIPLDVMRARALALMEGMGYGRNPLLIYAHSDTRHRHLHIISSRVGPDGRKINDRFEGVRARRILNQLQGIDAARDCQRDMTDALGYRFGSVRQFALLLEGKGYRIQQQGGEIRCFRHGSCQGSVSVEQIQRQVETQPVDRSVAVRLRGIILAHQSFWDGTLSSQGPHRKGGSRVWSSPLTEQLHQRLGLQFVFFSAGRHERPYGYVVIDHANRSVIKGGDVLRLAQLEGGAMSKNLMPRELFEQETKGREYPRGEGVPEPGDHASELVRSVEAWMQRVTEDAQADMRQVGTEDRRKRKRDRARGL